MPWQNAPAMTSEGGLTGAAPGAGVLYGTDLARIHAEAFGDLGQAAGRHLVELLRSRGVHSGRVIDLGCGAGALAEVADRCGFEAWGVDVSAAMVALARQRVPRGSFEVAALESVSLPHCAAVAAAGEVVSYALGTSAGESRLRELFKKVHAALDEGGVLLFDAAAPGRGTGAVPGHWDGDEWAILADVEETQDARTLTRRITMFIRDGEVFRRSREMHRLDLFPQEVVETLLAEAGFSVRVRDRYGESPLPGGLVVYEATR